MKKTDNTSDIVQTERLPHPKSRENPCRIEGASRQPACTPEYRGIPTIEMPAPFRPVNENGKPPSTLDQIIKEAQELGKYRALLNTGKTFEELKAKKTNF